MSRLVGMDPTEYLFPCYLLGDPNVRATRPRNLLGLTGVIRSSGSDHNRPVRFPVIV